MLREKEWLCGGAGGGGGEDLTELGAAETGQERGQALMKPRAEALETRPQADEALAFRCALGSHRDDRLCL